MKTAIGKNIYVVKGETNLSPYCNCLLIEDDTRAVIETGIRPDVINEIGGESIQLVLNSHYHPDHMHGNWGFKKAKIGFHLRDVPLLRSKEDYGRDIALGLWSKLMSGPFNNSVQFESTQDDLVFKDSMMVSCPRTRVDFTFADGDVFDLGKTKIRVIHTPGHCGGHCCFYCEGEGVLFSADIHFSNGFPWYGCGSSDVDELIGSINKLVEVEPRITVPAHGRVFKGSIKKPAVDLLDTLYRREDSILKILKKPHTLDELAGKKIIYSTQIHPFSHFWEKSMIYKHLERLVKMGAVSRKEENYFCG